jgi:hypothetical protein
MVLDLTDKAKDLLNLIANSLYDRDPGNVNPVFFSNSEITIVEQFLFDLIMEKNE